MIEDLELLSGTFGTENILGCAEHAMYTALPETGINVSGEGLPYLTERAINALVAANEPPRLFRQAGGVARLERSEEGRFILTKVLLAKMRFEMANAAPWVRNQFQKVVGTTPPKAVVENVLATPELPLPPIRGIANAPFFESNGTLVVEDGYAKASQLYLASDVAVPEIPVNPTPDDIKAAVAAIDDILADFPFVAEADRANAIALMLLPFCREMIDGPTPLHLFTAPTPGNGKSLLAQALLIPACGIVPMAGIGRSEEETRKVITTFLLSGCAATIFDNLSGKVDSPSLARLLTAPMWKDRLLGLNSEAALPNRAAWAATANNLILSTELARRSIEIRIDARIERPFTRTEFRHPKLIEFVRKNRGNIIAAALTLIQAWIAAGCPAPDQTMGSYEAWARVIGGILVVAGVDGFLGNCDRLLVAADEESETWRIFTAAWAERHGTASVAAKELLPLAGALDLGTGEERSQVTRLGKLLIKNRDRVFGGWRIERGLPSRNGQTWRLVATPAEPRRNVETNVSRTSPVVVNGSRNLRNLRNLTDYPNVSIEDALPSVLEDAQEPSACTSRSAADDQIEESV